VFGRAAVYVLPEAGPEAEEIVVVFVCEAEETVERLISSVTNCKLQDSNI
jgi:hypothetical protein